MTLPTQNVTSLWVESLQAAFSLARGERIAELRGEYTRAFDNRGLNPFSVIWGRVEAVEALLPELFTEESRNDPKDRIPREGITCSAHALRMAARAEADREFRAERFAASFDRAIQMWKQSVGAA